MLIAETAFAWAVSTIITLLPAVKKFLNGPMVPWPALRLQDRQPTTTPASWMISMRWVCPGGRVSAISMECYRNYSAAGVAREGESQMRGWLPVRELKAGDLMSVFHAVVKVP